MFNRVLTDCHGAGFVVNVNHHDFFGNDMSYDVQTKYDDGMLTCKNLPADQVRPVPEELTLAHRLGPDATPARRFIAAAVDDGTLQRLFEAYEPDSDAPNHLLHRQTRYAFAQAAETLDWPGMADAMESLPRVTSLSPSTTLYDWALEIAAAARDDAPMPERPHGLDAERARADARAKAIVPTTYAALDERERLAAFADTCRRWGF